MTFVILNYMDCVNYNDIGLVNKEDESGDIMFFDSKEKAEKYAEEELNGDSHIIELR